MSKIESYCVYKLIEGDDTEDSRMNGDNDK